MVEFEPSQGTQQAAAGVLDPQLHDFTPLGYDQHQAYALSQLHTVTTPDAISDVKTSNAGHQKVFTVANPPTRWDVAEVFTHVQGTARHSTHIVGLSKPGPLRQAKLRIFERIRLLYHVALAGWGAALNGYAYPSATFLLGPPARITKTVDYVLMRKIPRPSFSRLLSFLSLRLIPIAKRSGYIPP